MFVGCGSNSGSPPETYVFGVPARGTAVEGAPRTVDMCFLAKNASAVALVEVTRIGAPIFSTCTDGPYSSSYQVVEATVVEPLTKSGPGAGASLSLVHLLWGEGPLRIEAHDVLLASVRASQGEQFLNYFVVEKTLSANEHQWARATDVEIALPDTRSELSQQAMEVVTEFARTCPGYTRLSDAEFDVAVRHSGDPEHACQQ